MYNEKKCIASVCFLTISVLCCWAVAPAYSEVIDQIVAILNGDLILLSEVREHAGRPVTRAVANLQTAATLEEDTLHYVIERQLLTHEVQYLAVPRDTEQAKEFAIRYIAAAYYQQDEQAFSNAVQTAGIAEAELDRELMLYMKGIDYIRRKYRFSEDVEDADTILSLYTNWLKSLKSQATIQLVF